MCAELTQPMRDWLASQPADVLLRDFLLRFQVRYQVTPELAGQLLGVWVQTRRAAA